MAFPLRKMRTRRVSRSANHRLRSHWNLNAYKSAKRGLQYDSRRRSRWHYVPLFHDSKRYRDPLIALTGLMPSALEERYHAVSDEVAGGLSDRRVFHFDTHLGDYRSGEDYGVSPTVVNPARTPARIRGTKYLVAPPAPVVTPSGKTGAFLSFNVPPQVMVCVRRKQRKEVLFALGKAGGRHKSPKWSDESYIRC